MATIKSYTDLSQSKKLAEILPLESADLSYMSFDNHITLCPYIKMINDGFDEDEVIPCWSLVALLDVLPIVDLCTPTLKMKLNHKYYMELCIDYANHKYISTNDYDNPVDACAAMIGRLHELNLL